MYTVYTGYVTRECSSDGSWKPNTEFNNTDGWSNYTGCMGGPTPDIPKDYSVIIVLVSLCLYLNKVLIKLLAFFFYLS
jgi:hypothetical protein